MVDSMDICKSLNINTGTIIKSPGMLNLFLIILRLKKMCTHAVKKLSYPLGSVPH